MMPREALYLLSVLRGRLITATILLPDRRLIPTAQGRIHNISMMSWAGCKGQARHLKMFIIITMITATGNGSA